MIVFVQNLVPGLTAVASTKDAALGVRAVSVPESGDKCDIRILGINDDRADVLGVPQANVLPGFAAIDRLVYAVAIRHIAANAGLTRTHVNDVVVGIGYRDRADGRS